MKSAIILHGAPGLEEYFDPGCPSSSNHHWLPWLQKQLIIHNYAAHTPEIPKCWQPDYEIWCREFERYEINENTSLIGHSCGGGFIARWLSDHRDTLVDKVILVAPWVDPQRTRTDDFFDFEIDPDMASRTNGFAIFNSDNDAEDIQASAYLLRDSVNNCYFREFNNYGHFCLNDMQTDEFPDLLELIVSQ